MQHSHGYAVQTAADLGLFGLLVSLALLLAWIGATGRTLGWRLPGFARRRPPEAGARGLDPRVSFGPEHVAMATLATVVLVFGVHSFVDWTWYVPGTAVIALVAAGWVAGRGPLSEPAPDARMLGARLAQGVRQPFRVALACGALALGLLAGWAAWQPLRSVDSDNEALALPPGPASYAKAIALTEKAEDQNPLSIDPLLTRALVESTAQHPDRARAALVEAIRRQPSNPQTWEYLSRFAVEQENNPKLALRLLGPALYLDPQSPTGAQDYLAALRLLRPKPRRRRSARPRRRPSARPRSTARRADRPADEAPRRLPGRPARRSRDRAPAAAASPGDPRMGDHADLARQRGGAAAGRRRLARGSRWPSAAWSTAPAPARSPPGRGRASSPRTPRSPTSTARSPAGCCRRCAGTRPCCTSTTSSSACPGTGTAPIWCWPTPRPSAGGWTRSTCT